MAITTKNNIRVTLVNSLRVNNLHGGTEKVFFEMANYLTANLDISSGLGAPISEAQLRIDLI